MFFVSSIILKFLYKYFDDNIADCFYISVCVVSSDNIKIRHNVWPSNIIVPKYLYKKSAMFNDIVGDIVGRAQSNTLISYDSQVIHTAYYQTFENTALIFLYLSNQLH